MKLPHFDESKIQESVIMRRYLLPISLAVLSFGVLLPGMLFYLSKDWRRDDHVIVVKPAASAVKQQGQETVAAPQAFDEREALRVSQAAIGKQLGNYTFLDRGGRTVRLADYRGKPLVISMIYTHCPIICATTTRSLSALKLSQEALGEDSFGVLTVG
ncbi:MAG: SCO family protein, partial [Gallionella sp.]|nr:SCO family protein [Gallionella sp.]